MIDIYERRFYKFVTTILKMSKEEAVKYIIDESISRQSLAEYTRNYLLYNPDSMTEEILQETVKFLEEVKALHLDNIRGMNKKERMRRKKESIRQTIQKNKKLSQDVYIKNRHLLEEYVDFEAYIYTILGKYKKDYTFFMDLVETASTSEDTYDKVLYEQVKKLLTSKENNVNLTIETIAPLVLGYIQEGIKIGNVLVPFTIFDYYDVFGVPIEYFFLYQDENIERSTLDEIRIFFKENYLRLKNSGVFIDKQLITFNVEYELKTEYTFNVNGEDIKPSFEERRKIIDYLIENNFPLEFVIYKQALRRYAQGLFDFNKKLKRTFE